MSSLYFLIPIAVAMLAIGILAFVWSVRSGQFEDMEGPAHRILMDDDDPRIPGNSTRGGDDHDPPPPAR